MKRSQRAVLLFVGAVALICFLVGGLLIVRHFARQRELEAIMEAERAEQQRIVEAYVRLHYAFFAGPDPDVSGTYWTNDLFGQYEQLPDHFSSRNPYGIDTNRYLLLHKYYIMTGLVLSYEAMVAYFSQEFELDGTRRLYDNGKHPEIQAFVEWMWDERRSSEVWAYIRRIENIYFAYSRANSESFQHEWLFSACPQMLAALVRAEADPDYALDLTSLLIPQP